MASNIKNVPSMLTMVHGYTPFTPDAGIFCGGYQGPLYPNPSTFVIPGFSFDTSLYQNPVATPYTMAASGDDPYDSGFGIGNPGINYRNPGHILGILDTYGRMSYGLSIIKASRDALESFSITPGVTINLPLLKFVDGTFDGTISNITINLSNLYPIYTEIPSDYLNAFVEDGELVLNPRTGEPFVFGGTKHTPTSTNIDLETLFRNVSLESYYGLAEIYQGFYSSLANQAFNLESQVVIELTSDGPWGTENTLISSLPNPINDNSNFPQGDNSTIFVEDAGFFGEYEYLNKCKSMSVSDSLKLMTGSTLFHKANDIQYEYRSLTELNSVINVLPVQINGLKYYYTIDTSSSPRPSWDSAGGIVYVSYLICDIVLNTFQKDNIEISVDGNITTIDDINSPLNHRNVSRQVSFINSLTNKFGWDRKWYDLDDNIVQSIENQDNFYISKTLQDGVPPEASSVFDILPTSTDFSFTKTHIIGNGLHTIRSRIIVKSKVLIDIGQPFFNGYEQLTLNLNINGGNVNLLTSFIQL